MAQFLQIPVEILQQICSLLCCHCRFPQFCTSEDTMISKMDHALIAREHNALANLCRTSKRIRAIAEPYLYHFILVHRSIDPIRLLKTLIKCPGISALVKQVVFCELPPDYKIPFHDVFLLENAIEEKLGIDFEGRAWYRGPSKGAPLEGTICPLSQRARDEILTELLLTYLPNVEKAMIRLEYGFRHLLTASHFNTLRSLKTLVASYLHCRPDLCFGVVSGFAALAPNVKALTCYGLKGEKYWDEPTSWKGVSRLTLLRNYGSTEAVTQLISSCDRLENFIYEYAGHTPSQRQLFHIEPMDLIRALQQHRATLQQLDMRVNGRGAESNSELEVVVTLQDFTSLKTLSLDYWPQIDPGLENQDTLHIVLCTLPPSLETLFLYLDVSTVHEDLLLIAQQAKSGILPNLKQVQLIGIDQTLPSWNANVDESNLLEISLEKFMESEVAFSKKLDGRLIYP